MRTRQQQTDFLLTLKTPLAKRLIEKNITISELARKTGITYQAIWFVACGIHSDFKRRNKAKAERVLGKL